MAPITTDGAEQESQPKPDQNGPGETAETGREEQAVPDPKQEPGDNNESRAGMDVSGGRGEPEQPGDIPSRVPDTDKEAASPTEKPQGEEGEPGGELTEPGKSPVQGSLASSVDSAQEGSRVLKEEQREGENVSCSPPAERTKTAERAGHGAKRRASVELTSSDGEPLSRMDSEDRSVEAARGLHWFPQQPRGGVRSQHGAKFTGFMWARDSAFIASIASPPPGRIVPRHVRTTCFNMVKLVVGHMCADLQLHHFTKRTLISHQLCSMIVGGGGGGWCVKSPLNTVYG